jgi:hypothetical protein
LVRFIKPERFGFFWRRREDGSTDFVSQMLRHLCLRRVPLTIIVHEAFPGQQARSSYELWEFVTDIDESHSAYQQNKEAIEIYEEMKKNLSCDVKTR